MVFVRDCEMRLIVDPGMVPDPDSILRPLEALGESPDAVTDVVFSHHHPDHTLHAALFAHARFHDHWAMYKGDLWEDRRAEGFAVSPAVRLIETPGHSPQDVTTLVGSPEGIVAFTHLWGSSIGPAEDPRATDPEALHQGRARVVEVAALIVPGHGPAFSPDERTPR